MIADWKPKSKKSTNEEDSRERRNGDLIITLCMWQERYTSKSQYDDMNTYEYTREFSDYHHKMRIRLLLTCFTIENHNAAIEFHFIHLEWLVQEKKKNHHRRGVSFFFVSIIDMCREKGKRIALLFTWHLKSMLNQNIIKYKFIKKNIIKLFAVYLWFLLFRLYCGVFFFTSLVSILY